MVHDYVNDVFISYTHRGAVYKWIEYLHDLLEDWLPYYLPYQPKIFLDRQIEVGDHWPSRLRLELKRSRCLLAIWSPVYFSSKWCITEFESFRARENMLGLRTEQNPSGLIYAILFASPEYLPTKVKKIQYNDLSKWTFTSPAFKDSLSHLEFEQRVKDLCSELAKMILSAPNWQDWPVRSPTPISSTFITNPRL